MCIAKKRMLSLLLTLCMVIGLAPSTVFADGLFNESVANAEETLGGETIVESAEVVYVSADGKGNGSVIDNPMPVSALKNLAVYTTVRIVGTITLTDAVLPNVAVIFEGAGSDAAIQFAALHFNADAVFRNIAFDNRNAELYVCGHRLVIDETVSENTKGKLYVYGGSDKEDVTGNPVIIWGATFVNANIYGGGYNHKIVGNTSVTVYAGQVNNVYGGGWGGYGSPNDATVEGNTTVNINGGICAGTSSMVAGGGFVNGPNAVANVTGVATVNVTGGEIKGNNARIIAGGCAESDDSTATVNSTVVNFDPNDTFVSGGNPAICGGGFVDGLYSNCDVSVLEKAVVNVNAADRTKTLQISDIYGAGYTKRGNGNNAGAKTTEVNVNCVNGNGSPRICGAGYGDADVEHTVINVIDCKQVKVYACNGMTGNGAAYVKETASINIENGQCSVLYPFEVYGKSKTPSDEANKTITTVTFTGENKISKISSVDHVIIPEGTSENPNVLEEGILLSQPGDKLFAYDDNNVNHNVTQEANTRLILHKDNQIAGEYRTGGELVQPAEVVFVVGTATAIGQAKYKDSDNKAKAGTVFLKSTGENAEPYAEFGYTNQTGLEVENREISAPFTREWYLTTKAYTVSFEENGGAPVDDKENVVHGETIELPVPTRNGYSFDGWYTDDNTFENKFDVSTPITANITLYAKWSNAIPQIDAEDKTLTVGDPFNPLEDVTATDKEDGDITKDIEVVKNDVDTSKAGTYEVTYKATDSQGLSCEKTIVVTVTQKPLVPPTGDNNNIALWIALMFISGASLVIAGVYKKKKHAR